MESLTALSEGDMRRALNILQVTHLHPHWLVLVNAVKHQNMDTLGTSVLFRGCPLLGGSNIQAGGGQFVHCREVFHS